MDDHDSFVNEIAEIICNKSPGLSAGECHKTRGKANPLCSSHSCCRIDEKSDEQLNYIIEPYAEKHSFLRACPGSGKTEVVGLRTAYIARKWTEKHTGIAVLTFTNNAADVIRERASQFAGFIGFAYPHYIGTFDSWILGYIANPFSWMLTKYEGRDDDKSLRIVDSLSDAGFLNSFKAPFSYCYYDKDKHEKIKKDKNNKNVIKQMPIFANQVYWDCEFEHYKIVRSNQFTLSDKEILDSTAFKEFYQAEKMTAEKQRHDLFECKKKFYRKGFATFQDVESIVFRLLQDKDNFRKLLARRFPIVIVDECQDLSWGQMRILKYLMDEGAVVHFVGDFNQAIYAFKKVFPEKIQEFVNENGFKEMQLSKNFRSLDPIVKVCNQISGDCSGHIKGRDCRADYNPCLYVEYNGDDGLSNLPQKFQDIMSDRNVNPSNACILARSHKLVAEIRQGRLPDENGKPYLAASALFLWQNTGSMAKKEAIESMGKFLHMSLFCNENVDKGNQYCPESVENKWKWRVFIAKVLNSCLKHSKLGDLDIIWKNWTKSLRTNLPEILKEHEHFLSLQTTWNNSLKCNAPDGQGNQPVIRSLQTMTVSRDVGINVTTIHSVKGQTFEAIMMVSAKDKRSDGGHWEQWLDRSAEDGEHMRFSYVGSSRPQDLLIWAVPGSLKKEQKRRLEELGFKAG